MSDNNYQTPDSSLLRDADDELEPATRLSRFLASVVDGIILMVLLVPVLFFIGFFDLIMNQQEPSLQQNILIAVLSVAVYVGLNFHFLRTNGQTIGKRLLNIRIVDLEGNLPSLQSHLLPRYAVYLLIGYIPVVGGLLSLVNVLFIFRKDRRCLHDLVGKTMVVEE